METFKNKFIKINKDDSVERRGVLKTHANRIGKVVERFTATDNEFEFSIVKVRWRDYAENYVESKKKLAVVKTRKEIKEAIEKLQVNIWDNVHRKKDTQSDECEHCGKKVGKNPLYVHIMITGVIVPNGISEDDIANYGEQSQGCFPIGNGCAKKLFGKDVDKYTFRFDK